tara:strand:- start:163 stop:996 length:834 start_codon:yes stop_codon:yes gene_type:complete
MDYMDYKNIFENFSKSKKILSKLIQSRDLKFIKTELDSIQNFDLRKVIKTQYLHLYQKQLNLLDGNKSTKILLLEETLRRFKVKQGQEKVKMVNNLGYFNILLLLLNLSKEEIDEFKMLVNIENSENDTIQLQSLILDMNDTNNDKYLVDIIERTADSISKKLLEKINSSGSNVNIEFKDDTVTNKVITRHIDSKKIDKVDPIVTIVDSKKVDKNKDNEVVDIDTEEQRLSDISKLIPLKVEKEFIDNENKNDENKSKKTETVKLSEKDMDLIKSLG